MVRVNGIQANLSNPLLGVEGERYEADNVVVDQGNIARADTVSPTISLKERKTGSKASARIR
jgi:hypothetical protein